MHALQLIETISYGLSFTSELEEIFFQETIRQLFSVRNKKFNKNLYERSSHMIKIYFFLSSRARAIRASLCLRFC